MSGHCVACGAEPGACHCAPTIGTYVALQRAITQLDYMGDARAAKTLRLLRSALAATYEADLIVCDESLGEDGNCPGCRLERLLEVPAGKVAAARADFEGRTGFTADIGPWLKRMHWEHVCRDCGAERTDYEGPNGAHLPSCPNCGSEMDPVSSVELAAYKRGYHDGQADQPGSDEMEEYERTGYEAGYREGRNAPLDQR